MVKKVSTKKKVSLLQINNDVIRDGTLSANDFVLFAYLKYLSSIKKTSTLRVYRWALMHKTGMIDKRTFNKSIDSLTDYGLFITKPITSNNGVVELEINTQLFICQSGFTQLPTCLFSFIHKIGNLGYRFLYYYESYINRTLGESKMFCFVGFKKIAKDLGISEPTIVKYNDILKENNLLRIIKSKIGDGSTINKDGSFIAFGRWNNHYTPLRGNMRSDDDSVIDDVKATVR